MRTMNRALAVLALLGTGCTSTEALVGPRDGGRPWSKFVSEHVVLETDVEASDARQKISSFERMHAAVALAMHAAPGADRQRVEVVVFAELADYFTFAGKNRTSRAYFLQQAPGDLEPRPVLVLQDHEVSDDTRISFQHELAHRFVHAKFTSVPRWLDEGLAQYFSTVEPRADGLVIGASTNRDFWARSYAGLTWMGQAQQSNLPLHQAPSASALLGISDASFYAAASKNEGEPPSREDREKESANYTAAWRLVHYFMQEAPPEDRARFSAYLVALERGEHDGLLTHFGADVAGLDERFLAYLVRRPTRIVMPSALSSREPEVKVTELADADVHILWSRLYPRSAVVEPGTARAEFHGKDNMAILEAEKAIASDAASAEAQYQAGAVLLLAGRFDEARVHIDEALRRKPGDPRMIYAKIAIAEQTRAPLSYALVDELGRTATSANELQAAAYILGEKRLPDGLLLAARAVAADPLCWTCQRTRARLLARAGAVDDAIVAIDRAITLAPEGMSTNALLGVKRELEARR